VEVSTVAIRKISEQGEKEFAEGQDLSGYQ
jgi:hypothetical protein